MPKGAHESLREVYEKMLATGGERLNVKPSGIEALDALYEELPNFREVLDDIRKQLALAACGADPLEIPPMLLLGPPGIGKTHFGKRLSQLLGTGFALLGMSALTAGWIIGGASSGWKNAKPGKVFDTLVSGHYANPVLMVDEIDKAGHGEYDPLGAMYALLEHDTAREFIEFTSASVAWKRAFATRPARRVDLLGADHTCAQAASQIALEAATVRWLAADICGH